MLAYTPWMAVVGRTGVLMPIQVAMEDAEYTNKMRKELFASKVYSDCAPTMKAQTNGKTHLATKSFRIHNS